MIRAFVGVRIDPNVAQRISEARSQLARSLTGIRWVPKENLHFTLKFLGAVEAGSIAPMTEALERALRDIPRFLTGGRGIGVFPDIRRPRVLWVGLTAQELETLAERVEAALGPFGFPKERRNFMPHLTIGRWRRFGAPSQKLKQEIDRWRDYDFGETIVEEVVFFQSVLRPDGAVYSPLRVIRLSRQGSQV